MTVRQLNFGTLTEMLDPYIWVGITFTSGMEIIDLQVGSSEAGDGLQIPTGMDHTEIPKVQPKGEFGEPFDRFMVIT